MYISLPLMGELKDADRVAFYKAKQEELNAKDFVDYEAAVGYKLAYCREFFSQEGQAILSSPDLWKRFFHQEKWSFSIISQL